MQRVAQLRPRARSRTRGCSGEWGSCVTFDTKGSFEPFVFSAFALLGCAPRITPQHIPSGAHETLTSRRTPPIATHSPAATSACSNGSGSMSWQYRQSPVSALTKQRSTSTSPVGRSNASWAVVTHRFMARTAPIRRHIPLSPLVHIYYRIFAAEKPNLSTHRHEAVWSIWAILTPRRTPYSLVARHGCGRSLHG